MDGPSPTGEANLMEAAGDHSPIMTGREPEGVGGRDPSRNGTL